MFMENGEENKRGFSMTRALLILIGLIVLCAGITYANGGLM